MNIRPEEISSVIKEQQEFPFDFKPNKLNEEMHLIDVIAIIQELNINKERVDE